MASEAIPKPEAHFSGRPPFLARRRRNADARIAFADQLNDASRVALEMLVRFRKVEPFAEHGMGSQRRKFSDEAGLVLSKGANQNALPGLALGCQEDLMVAIEHDRAAAEP